MHDDAGNDPDNETASLSCPIPRMPNVAPKALDAELQSRIDRGADPVEIGMAVANYIGMGQFIAMLGLPNGVLTREDTIPLAPLNRGLMKNASL